MIYSKFVGFVLLIWMVGCYGRHEQKPNGKYPLEVHQLFRDRLSKGRLARTEGVWSSWGPWSPCSRTCGGGVTMQTRHCISRPVTDVRKGRGRRRKHLETNEVTNQCVGLYKRYHLCNPQECPEGRDFRAEQCASFNARPFRGRVYFWEPFLKAGDECALNCRAVGMGFYATLNQTAKDGTPCYHPMTALLQMAPAGTRGVCVGGLCKSVSADGIIGAISSPSRLGSITSVVQAPQELCPACVTGCRTISGLFTRPQLPPGYSLVTQVPKGACRLVVAQLKHTGNYIALRHPNGTFILNGSPSQMGQNLETTSSGTRFIYRRQATPLPEAITASGPLSHPIDIYIYYTQPNPGIKYEYMLPVEQTVEIAPPSIEGRKIQGGGLREGMNKVVGHSNGDEKDGVVEARRLEKPLTAMSQGDDSRPLRRRRRKFAWKIMGFSGCSKTCGGGIQYPTLACIREHNQATVLERRCANLEKPRNQTQRCNTQACPAHWAGEWSACSATCGPGQQTRVLECMQEINSALTMRVKDGACLEPRPPTTRRCDVIPCETRDNELEQELPTISQWYTEPWSPCSVSCGSGQRTRQVICSGRCRPEDRPPHLEPCFGLPCQLQTPQNPLTSSSNTSPHTASPTTHIYPYHHIHHHKEPTRKHTQDENPETNPEILENNGFDRDFNQSNNHHYNHHAHRNYPLTSSVSESWWMVTDWTDQCSQQCGTGTQSRWVICPTGECDPNKKPDVSRACSSEKMCGGRWFAGPWGKCKEACGDSGKQTREVLCIVHIRGQSRIVSDMTCPTSEKPSSERLCDGVCSPKWFLGEWGPCEGHCPNGVQRREVRCLEYDGRYATGCGGEMPQVKRGCHCAQGLSTKTDYTSRENSQAQDEPSLDHRGCSDQFTNCALVVQARLCQYPYYKSSCCISCRRAQQDSKE